MAKIPQTEVDEGLVILQQDLIDQFGLVTAAVYSRAAAYCGMSDGVCKASQQTIADDLQLSRECVNKHLRVLCEAGYLEDLTPTLKKHPHHYRDTGKAGLRIIIKGYSGVNVDDTSGKPASSGVNVDDTRKKRKKAGVNVDDTEGAGVSLDHTNLVVVVNPLNTTDVKQQHKAVTALREVGVGERKAGELAKTKPYDRIMHAIDVYAWTRHQGAARRQGWLIGFLENDWDDPADYVPAAARCSECWQPLTHHAPECRARYGDSIVCPYCHQYPCCCDDEDDGYQDEET